MKISNPTRTLQDESGQWWYLFGPLRVRTRVYEQICGYCKEPYIPPYRAVSQRSACCSKKCGARLFRLNNPDRWKGANSTRWQGGRRVQRGGYIGVWMPEHPSLEGTKRKYVLEHRLVMEEMLKRPLIRTEQVHHKNGIRDDNRPENLELWVLQQPAGARVNEQQHCKTCTCFAC